MNINDFEEFKKFDKLLSKALKALKAMEGMHEPVKVVAKLRNGMSVLNIPVPPPPKKGSASASNGDSRTANRVFSRTASRRRSRTSNRVFRRGRPPSHRPRPRMHRLIFLKWK